MSPPSRSTTALLAAALVLAATPVSAQQTPPAPLPADSARAGPPPPPWFNRVRYGGGPSVGPPPSDYTGALPPAHWCLRADGRASGDFGMGGGRWRAISRSWLRQVLSDSTDHGAVWRQVLGGAPHLTPADSIVEVTDERTCREVAAVLHRSLLGWQVGPPPVIVFRVRDYLIAYPSNARRGEFGLAAGMSLAREIQGVATW